MNTISLASKDTRINWRVATGNRETLEKAATEDGTKLSPWLDRYGMPALLRIAEKQLKKRVKS